MEEDSEERKPPSGAVESDPKKRYWRFDDVLGRGAFKTVFKAFDSREGTEVAWNKVLLGSVVHGDVERRRLFSEIHVLKRLKHKNIMTFHDYWLDDKNKTLNFITELFTHGSLKKFRARHKHLELQVLKKWAWQILQGLVYLHGHEPPIIHRDLKCDNILINGVTGDLKIGDLGLATLWKGLAPLSVQGTPEFMAPEVFDEKYDERVDVYAFGMLLLELVSMDYPYCECTNPAAIYKKISQGVYPASLDKIRTKELREFIELCIAYEPCDRPEARKLLKHPFFDSIRKSMEPDRQLSDEMDLELEPRRSYTSSGSESARVEPALSRNGSAIVHSEAESEEGGNDEHSVATSDGVKIRIECSKGESNHVLYFTLKYEKPGGKHSLSESFEVDGGGAVGVPTNIQFPFDIEDDTAEQILAEMSAEGSSSDLDIVLTEEESTTIGNLIAMEVDKWKLKDEGDLTAFVNVMRPPCDPMPENPCALVHVDSLEVEEELETKMGDMCQSMATDLTEENVFRTLREKSLPIMEYVTADSSRRSIKQRQVRREDDFPSDEYFTETNVMFPPLEENPTLVEAEEPREDANYDSSASVSSNAIDIPRKRRHSGTHSALEHSHSMSSTMSDSRLISSTDGQNSLISRSIQRRLSGKHGMSVDGPSCPMRPPILRSMSITVEGSSSFKESPLKAPSPQVELSVFVVEPKVEPETPSTAGMDGVIEHEEGQDSAQRSNASWISMVTMKPATKKPFEGIMPTVPEVATAAASKATHATNPERSKKRTSSRRPDPMVARFKADEYQWSLVNGMSGTDQESTVTSTVAAQPRSAQISPQNSIRRSCELQLSGSPLFDHGMKSPSVSQDLDSCARSDMNQQQQQPIPWPLPPDATGMRSAASSIGAGASVDDIGEVDIQGQSHLTATTATTTAMTTTNASRPHTSASGPGLNMFRHGLRHLTMDSLSLHSTDDFFTPPPADCRSTYELGRTWKTESIRAFRRDEGATTVAGPSFHVRSDLEWRTQQQMSSEAKQSVNRMFNSCADLSHMFPETNETNQHFPFSDRNGFGKSTHPSPPSDAGITRRAAPPLPFPDSSFPLSHKGTNTGKKSTCLLNRDSSNDIQSLTECLQGASISDDGRKSSKSHSKELRRQKALENIDKMQEQQLAGLCRGAAVGVASSKTIGGRSHHRPSMKG